MWALHIHSVLSAFIFCLCLPLPLHVCLLLVIVQPPCTHLFSLPLPFSSTLSEPRPSQMSFHSVSVCVHLGFNQLLLFPIPTGTILISSVGRVGCYINCVKSSRISDHTFFLFLLGLVSRMSSCTVWT